MCGDYIHKQSSFRGTVSAPVSSRPERRSQAAAQKPNAAPTPCLHSLPRSGRTLAFTGPARRHCPGTTELHCAGSGGTLCSAAPLVNRVYCGKSRRTGNRNPGTTSSPSNVSSEVSTVTCVRLR
jgi:hypothetical protein